MSDPYGGPFAEWNAATTYTEGDRVSYGGYIYELMDGPSTGDNPRTATFTATLSNSAFGAGGGTETLTMRKWRIWDYPAAYYMAKLRGLPPFSMSSFTNQQTNLSEEIRTFIVRTDYQNNGDAAQDLYHSPTSASYSGYGMPAGMDTNWGAPPDPDEVGKELIWSFSAAKYAYDNGRMLAPFTYDYNLGVANGLCFQPSTIVGSLVSNGVDFDVLPAWFTETQGQMISCYQTFSRDFEFTQPGPSKDTFTTASFGDNWTGAPPTTSDGGDTIGTDPDYDTP